LKQAGQYDYIIAGTGCAGLSLAMHLVQSGKFRDKKILLIDREEKKANDRTWCFWETEPGLFEEIVHRRWKEAWFHGNDFSRLLTLAPYEYKLIRGIDFYDHCLAALRKEHGIEIVQGTIDNIESEGSDALVRMGDGKYHAQYIFNSILKKPTLRKGEFYLLQHFKGWVVETAQPLFDPVRATLMDFRVLQDNGTSFVYVMPFTPTTALVEYTLFSGGLLQSAQYAEALRKYMRDVLKTEEYCVLEEETGVIPMTNHRFTSHDNRIINIGTAGGQTKASSGYTFRFIQKHSAAITKQLIEKGNPFLQEQTPARFHFYDSVLLNILHGSKLPGRDIFSRLFRKNDPRAVLAFLDNESSWKDEWKIITSLPVWPFLKAAIQQM
jgi:lycopene beta-cyclase